MSANFIFLFSVFPVQTMNSRFPGQIESGRVHVGDIITTLPSNETAAVKTILVGSDDREELLPARLLRSAG